jgi:hypothetical protein
MLFCFQGEGFEGAMRAALAHGIHYAFTAHSMTSPARRRRSIAPGSAIATRN